MSRKPSHSSSKIFVGTVDKNQSGFSFVKVRDSKIKDIYLSNEESVSLMSGDIVEVKLHQGRSKPYGELVRIVERAKTEIFGRVLDYQGGTYVHSMEGDFFTIRGRVPSHQHYVIAKIVKYPSRRHRGEVSILQSLGKDLTPKHDTAITVAEFGLPQTFSSRSLEEAFTLKLVTKKYFEEFDPHHDKRRDLTDVPFVTIDGEDAKDFDDAIYVETQSGAIAFKLYVAIADVSFYVKEESSLDEDALLRGTSVYFPGECLPMLPPMLSEDLCSLRPREKKLSFVVEIHYDRDAQVVGQRFYEAIICTKARLTYTQVEAHIHHEGKLPVSLKAAIHLYKKLKSKKHDRGALDFDIAKSRVIVDADKNPTALQYEERLTAHELIELFMVAANEQVGKVLKESGYPNLYRIHEPPAPSSLSEINTLLKNFGVEQRLKSLSPVALSALLDRTAKNKHLAWLHPTLLRLQKQAKYSHEPLGHFGLSLDDYSHFTSPIRRYPDLVTHRWLKRYLTGKKSTQPEQQQVELLGEYLSQRERRATEAERFIVKRKQAWFLRDKVGDEVSVTISGCSPRGVFVEMIEFGGAEGFISLAELLGTYEYDELHGVMRKVPKGAPLKMGDPLTAQIINVNTLESKIDLREIKS